MDRKHHWNQVYETKGADDISWFQARPEISLRLIAATGVVKADAIMDVGGGTSSLVDHLLDDGYRDLTVLDISGAALKQAQTRLGNAQVWSDGSRRTSRAFGPIGRSACGTTGPFSTS